MVKDKENVLKLCRQYIPHLGSYCSIKKVLINFHEASIEISIKLMVPLALPFIKFFYALFFRNIQ
jgi:hypothetical protein